MNEAAHAVLLDGVAVGSLLQRGDVARFVFDDEYWASPDRLVLGLWFEDNPRTSPSAALRLPPWFSNLLPEGRMREWVARERGVSAQRELQLLLHIGSDLPGAVQVIPDAGDTSRLSSVKAPLPVGDSRAKGAGIWKFSLAGVGMKFSLLRDGDRLTMPGANALGDWIVKLPDPVFAQVPENEYAVMQLASRVGIQVPQIELIHRDALPDIPDVVWPNHETYAFAIRRFDRNEDRRIHIEDFTQVRGWYSDAKYDGSFESVAALAYRGRDHWSLREFVRRFTFNLLVGNGDAHLKNWSLIYADGRIPTLSPAYDLVSTGGYYPANSPDSIGLRFHGNRLFSRVTRSGFESLQGKLGVERADVLDVVDETIDLFFAESDQGGPAELPSFLAEWVRPHAVAMRRQISS